MLLKLVAVGRRMPAWVDQAVEEFSRRFSHGLQFQLVKVNTAKRGRDDNPEVYKNEEGRDLLAATGDSDFVVALDVEGKAFSTEGLSAWLDKRILDARPLVFMVGGPDGLSGEVLARADARWSLSALTLPHGLARVVVVEALYRANSYRLGHPYHRA